METLGDRQYVSENGYWYRNGEFGREARIEPSRILVRTNSERSPRLSYFLQLGIPAQEVVPIGLGWYRIIVSQGPFAAASQLESSGRFDRVAFDAIGRFTSTPNDPLYGDQQNLPYVDYEAAHPVHGPHETVVAVIDTGIESDHEDLEGAVIAGYDFKDDDSDPSPDPTYSEAYHGTAVAGIIAARTDNGVGISGIAGGYDGSMPVHLLNIRVDDDPNESGPYLSSVAEGVNFARTEGADVRQSLRRELDRLFEWTGNHRMFAYDVDD